MATIKRDDVFSIAAFDPSNRLTLHQLAQQLDHREDELRQAFLDSHPLLMSDDTWQKIIRPDTFCALFTAIDNKSNALVEKCHICSVLSLVQCL